MHPERRAPARSWRPGAADTGGICPWFFLAIPSLYSAMLDVLTPEASASLHCVIVAGEECKPETAIRHFDRLPQTLLYNEYGPTECAVWSAASHF